MSSQKQLLLNNLDRLKKWVEIDIQSPNRRNTFITVIENDKKIISSSLSSQTKLNTNKYNIIKRSLSSLGQFDTELCQDKLSKEWNTTINVIKVIIYLKRIIRNYRQKNKQP